MSELEQQSVETSPEAGEPEGFPELIEMAPEEAAAPVPDGETLLMQLLQGLHQVTQARTYTHQILVHTSLLPPLTEALENADTSLISAENKEKIKSKLVPMTEELDIRIITGFDVKRQFLDQHFGPREQGGNGLLPKMIEYLQRTGQPVQITLEWLEHRYLDEIAANIAPGIQVASAGLGGIPSLGFSSRR